MDNSLDAIQMAQARLDRVGALAALNLEIRWADTLQLPRTLGRRRFDTLLDCAMLHCFAPRQHRTYADSIATQVPLRSRPDACAAPGAMPHLPAACQLRCLGWLGCAGLGWAVPPTCDAWCSAACELAHRDHVTSRCPAGAAGRQAGAVRLLDGQQGALEGARAAD